ncbi:hypothetical protein ACLQ2Q_11545 [Microbacterium sp. DT81.1]|uniref:hypothetical protein n=1 Tax=Microbacterium sp. DT81.1 TaxID=3393413 RepID=UPI003CEA6415
MAESAAILSRTLQNEIPTPADVNELLVEGETPVASFRTFRDSATFTTKRLIVRESGTMHREPYRPDPAILNMSADSEIIGRSIDIPSAAVAITDRHAVRTASALAGVALVVAALTGCATPREASVSASPTTSSPPPSSAALSSSASLAGAAGTALVLPEACEDIYSDAMFAHLTATAPPLNDPGHTTPSTELAVGREVLDTAPTLRCTWGGPSEYGLSTNVTIVDPGQSASIEQAAVESGMTCTPHDGGTICRTREDLFVDGERYATVGETHYFRDNGWIATHWTNFAPEGYTEDIVATLWPSLPPTG